MVSDVDPLSTTPLVAALLLRHSRLEDAEASLGASNFLWRLMTAQFLAVSLPPLILQMFEPVSLPAHMMLSLLILGPLWILYRHRTRLFLPAIILFVAIFTGMSLNAILGLNQGPFRI
jgi:hypothetical protein